YYDRYTEGVIQLVELPPSSGIEAATDLNIGNVKNSGVEVQVGYSTNFGKLGFNASGNFTTVKNRLVKMYQGTPFGGTDARYQEDYSLGYLWGWQAGGIFQNEQEITEWKNTYEDGIGTNNQEPGDMYFLDVYGNPEPGEIVSFEPDGIDRKSTRLNSSHVKISYAVF